MNNNKISEPRYKCQASNDYEYFDKIETSIKTAIEKYNDKPIDSTHLKKNHIKISTDADLIKDIAWEISSLKGIYLKIKIIDNKEHIFYDDTPINHIFFHMIISYNYYDFIQNLKREKNNDFQPLKSYLNSIMKIMKITKNKALLSELKSELAAARNIHKVYTDHMKGNSLFTLLDGHNKLIEMNTDNKSMLNGSIPIEELNPQKIKNLCSFIDRQIASSHLTQKYLP